MYTDFVWQCPSCKGTNREVLADEYKAYTCGTCGKKSLLTFSVEVDDVELYEEPQKVVNLQKLIVSRDQGETWEEIECDTRDLNPETSPLNPNDLIKVPDGSIFKVQLNPRNSMLMTIKAS
ncbi:hypothetical protein [Paenibacillus amylolyticus]|uniref:hypothetical protein n=1 Tax=Paenibacillus amylolyticus TaxID=1451 RepID=UPI000FDC2F4A|nr:hypothetical protein [Paenibacillus amylolyticus]